MKKEFSIVNIKPEHFEFVSNTIKRRWEITQNEAESFTNLYLKRKNNNTCYVAEYKGVPIGMGTFHINNDIGIDLHPWCIGLWVNPQYRGNGIGYNLSLRRFSLARQLGYKKIYLDTVNAEGYHKKFGWKNTGIIGMYKNLPTIVMEYNL